MGSDFRKDWVRKKVTKYFGLNSEHYFDEMMATTEELEDKLDSYLDDDILPQGESGKFFYVYKTTYEKLVEEEIIVAQKVEKPVELEEPVQFVKPVKKGKKDKGKKGKKGKGGETPPPPPPPPADGEGAPPDGTEIGTTVEPETNADSPTAESPTANLTESQGENIPDSQTTETEASPLPSPELTDVEASDVEGTPKKEKKKKGKEKGGKGKKKKKPEPPPPEEEVEEFIYVPQIIQKQVTDYALHGGFMFVHDGLFDSKARFMYMYRRTDAGIPNFDDPDDADVEMPYYFLIGMTTGNLLQTVTIMFKNGFTYFHQIYHVGKIMRLRRRYGKN